MNRVLLIIVLVVSVCFPLLTSRADESIFFDRLFNSDDPLAARDDYGLLHQGQVLDRTDFDARHHCRSRYYFESGTTLTSDPAYVGALQRDLRRLSYYCGPIDGVFSQEVSEAIARMQKNYSMTATGTLTDPVRRALHLP
jgi:Putative peptidoglycan binding domain